MVQWRHDHAHAHPGSRPLGLRPPPPPGGIGHLAGQAPARGEQTPEVTREQDRLAAAELLVLKFPLWWYGPPAILKGWFDRVLAEGFAYGDADPQTGIPRRYGDGGLAGRRALVVVTVGEDAATLGPRGLSGDLDQVLFPLTHGVLWYTGIEVLGLHVVHDADSLGAEGTVRERERLAERLSRIESEGAVPFRALRDGDYAGTRALREDELPGRVDLGIHRVGG